MPGIAQIYIQEEEVGWLLTRWYEKYDKFIKKLLYWYDNQGIIFSLNLNSTFMKQSQPVFFVMQPAKMKDRSGE